MKIISQNYRNNYLSALNSWPKITYKKKDLDRVLKMHRVKMKTKLNTNY